MHRYKKGETEEGDLYKCSICGEIYQACDMFNSATCNGCVDFYSETSKRDAYHEKKPAAQIA